MLLFELFEALSPQQKRKVDSWKANPYPNKLLSVFKNNSRIIMPFVSYSIKPNEQVENFLKSNNYVITNYTKGTCQKPNDKRLFSIGKILTKLNNQEILKLYTNDPARNNANSTDSAIVYSIDKYDVAAMSTDRGWLSCMNLDGGEYCHKLKYDIKYGTIVAYLINIEDTDVDHPIARIAIKPFFCEENDDVIWWPEGKIYGSAPKHFLSEVQNWCEINFPIGDNIYIKQPDLYNDDKISVKYRNLSDEQYIKLLQNGKISLRDIDNPSEAIQMAAVKQDGMAIEYIDNPSEAVQMAAVQQNGYAIQYIKNPSEAVQMAAVKQYGNAIQYIDNPSEAVQMVAVKKNRNAIQFIDNPSEAVQMVAVKQNGRAIRYIKNPSEAIQIAAVKQYGNAIQFIDNPSEAIQIAAVKQDENAIQFIDNPSEAAQMAAVKQYGYAIQYIDNPSEAVQMVAVKQNGYAIRYIKNPSEAIQIAAVKQYGNAIQFIDNPSEAVQMVAVKQNGYAIRYINNPSEAVQMAAVKQNGYAIRHIKNPSEVVKKYIQDN